MGEDCVAVFPLLAARSLAAPFDYLVPAALADRALPGALVAVPLGRQTVLGVIVRRLAKPSHRGRLLPLRDVLDLPPLPTELLELAERVRTYYLTSLGAALALVTPPASALRLERVAVLSDEGRRALEDGEEGLVRYVQSRVLPRRRDTAVERLRRRGWLAVRYRVRLVRGGPAARCLRRGAGEGKRLGARQRAVLELLAGRAVLAESEVRARTGASKQALDSLLARGLVVEADEGESGGGQSGARRPAGPPTLPVLLPEQEAAVSTVVAAVGRGEEVLLHGVTGSGKTEVYLRAAAQVLASGHAVLMLVPEIALTGQTVARLQERFPGERIAVLHSGLSAAGRLEAFRELAAGSARVVIGARSAVFAPVQRLGLIIVDEEHDASYKQENEPRYDARTVARWRAQGSGACLVYGSATPSIEAFARVQAHNDLSRRVDGSHPPPLEIVDMRDIHTVLSPELRRALLAVVERGEKAILFLNRRGFASFLACAHCGHGWICPRCDVSLALFAGGQRLRCRLCGYSLPAPGSCPSCASLDVARYGYGTERLEREVGALVPGVDLLRLDSDVAASFARLQDVLTRFAESGCKILVGTQMVAKGHHFPEVTLVGVVNADLTLHFPDFRAEERTFAMLLQVGGRSGRGEREGRVIVQTLSPEARPIALAAAGEAERFYAGELERRRELGYPPATTLIALEVSSLAADKTAAGSRYLANVLAKHGGDGAQVMGPGPLSRERGRTLCRLVIKTTEVGKTLDALSRVLGRYGPEFGRRGVRLVADVEPQWL